MTDEQKARIRVLNALWALAHSTDAEAEKAAVELADANAAFERVQKDADYA